MKVERMVEIETNDIRIGDRIHVGNYTATCQDVTSKATLFLLDQYIRGMGDLQEALRSEEVLNIFKGISNNVVPFDNGYLLKTPFSYRSTSGSIMFRPVFLIKI